MKIRAFFLTFIIILSASVIFAAAGPFGCSNGGKATTDDGVKTPESSEVPVGTPPGTTPPGGSSELPPPDLEADTTPPTTSCTTPENGASGVPINIKAITVTFSEYMNGATVNDQTFTLKPKTLDTINGSVSYRDKSAVLEIPNTLLKPKTEYVVTVSSVVADLAGNHPADDFSCSFTTGTEEEITRPKIVRVDYGGDINNVALDPKIVVTFDKDMLGTTINSNTVQILDNKGNPAIEAKQRVQYFPKHKSAIIRTDYYLFSGKDYQLKVTTGVTDVYGNPLEEDYFKTFTTIPLAPPEIINSSPKPENEAQGQPVAVPNAITVSFSKPMDEKSLSEPGNVTIEQVVNQGAVDERVSNLGATVKLITPTYMSIMPINRSFTYDSTYRYAISGKVADFEKQNMGHDYSWSFRTVFDPSESFIVESTYPPADGSALMDITKMIEIKFNHPVDKSTVEADQVFILNNMPISRENITLQEAPHSDTVFINVPNLVYGNSYMLSIMPVVKDEAGNSLSQAYDLPFTVEAEPVAVPVSAQGPVLFGRLPRPNEQMFPVDAVIRMTFNKTINLNSANDGAVTINKQETDIESGEFNLIPVGGSFSLEDDDKSVVFTPSQNLEYNTNYKITIFESLLDIDGFHFEGSSQTDHSESWTFRTAAQQ